MFSFLKKIFNKIKSEDIDSDYNPDITAEDEDFTLLDRKKLNLSDEDELLRYVKGCCDQMKEATYEIDRATDEYRLVTGQLTDIEELEQLSLEDRKEINDCAARILELSTESDAALKRMTNMPEEQFIHMRRIEGDMPEALNKMLENEDYRILVRKDLQALEGEKMSLRMERRELSRSLKNMRDISVVIIFALICLCGSLLALQYYLGFEVRLANTLSLAIAAVFLTVIFLRFSKNRDRLTICEKKLNLAITAQNRVKIRYVNVTSLLEYSYARYQVSNSTELSYLWEKYCVEKEEREKLRQAEEMISDEQEELLRLLRQQRILKPEVWLTRAAAIIDPREMVEVRHELIVRRQALRKRLEYNENNRSSAKDEVMKLVKEYPDKAMVIQGIVQDYV